MTDHPNLASIAHAARHRGVNERTVRNWVGEGYFPVYKMRGHRGALVDIDEMDAALAALPPSKINPSYGSFGPKAKVVDLTRRPVVVTDHDHGSGA